MALLKKLLYTIIAFLIVCIGVCVVNFVIQILAIFIDVISRNSSSSAFIIVLWIVTGVFAAVFTFGAAEAIIKTGYSSQFTAITVISISVLAIIFAIILLSKGEFNHSPSEYSLILSNGYVFASFFLGCGLTALIARNLKLN